MTTTPDVYETHVPSSRQFDAGTFPVKKYQAQNGAELKILYGDRITQRKLSLVYNNMNDRKVEQFLEHYTQKQGTFNSFVFRLSSLNGVFKGWTGGLDTINKDGALLNPKNVKWSYASPPIVQNVYVGLSTLKIELTATF